MKVGIMQPYFIPYIGYWQLMNAVDKYVIYDDVNYINRGWINRNRILINGNPHYYHINIINASQNKKINEIQIVQNDDLIKKRIRMIIYAYKKSPYFSEVYPIIESILTFKCTSLVEYIKHSFFVICEYLDIKTELILSSSLNKNNSLVGQEKILNICELLGATEYYNSIGGEKLYTYEEFLYKKITLNFLKVDKIEYKQFDNDFIPNLSIIDVMMFNTVKEIKEFLHMYDIVDGLMANYNA